jgi:hypothetical protein
MLRIAVVPFEQQVELPASVLRDARLHARTEYRSQKKVLLRKLRAKKLVEAYPDCGVLLDLDAYIDDPPFPDALSISDFIEAAFADFDAIKPTALESFDGRLIE